ncbi:MAG: bifunctional (p)ppGpp synthetase/guanosine-3',5'-bis(diphosphate) 3'-pyrophosphohydrolase [Bacillota bacterium]
MTIEDLQRETNYSPEAWALIAKAYEFSSRAHAGQTRSSGDQFIQHPLEVARILAGLHLDAASIAAGLLHDVVEDTGISLPDIEEEFGPEVAFLVDGVTKLGRLENRSRVEEQVENWRKMFLAMSNDLRVILIKLADRLHNMRTLKYRPREKQIETANETLDIFAPLAHRLGISTIQWELEDLALRYKEPEIYRTLAEKVAKKRSERQAYTNIVIGALREKLQEAGIKSDIQGRAKHFYSIYRKMYIQGRDFNDIYDMVAVRIIVQSVRDCYAALGIVHTLWRPIPFRFKDYIAMPKSNMYQSLHTTVVGPQGEPFEIQIRTEEMHQRAEFGVAAHWKYKEGDIDDRDFEAKLARLREFLEWERDSRDAREFMQALKVDLFADEVFVFTPKGDVVELPAGAGPLDFAYRIHTDVGHHAVGAKVNGRMVPFTYVLKTGDIVEIMVNRGSAGPSRDWLDIVKTSNAKSKIRQWFKKERREENESRGEELLLKEARRQGLNPAQDLTEERLLEVGKRFSCHEVGDLHAAIGYGGLTAMQVVNRIKEEIRKERKEVVVEAEIKGKPRQATSTLGVRVEGIDNALIRFGRCCKPIPGDPIVGYITRGRGVSIHRRDCPNVVHVAQADRARLIDVHWDLAYIDTYPIELVVTGLDRPNLLSDILNAIADTRTNLGAVRAQSDRSGMATVQLTLEIHHLDHLQYITNRIIKVRDVFSVSRGSQEVD